jgi:hypothetical protein
LGDGVPKLAQGGPPGGAPGWPPSHRTKLSTAERPGGPEGAKVW